MTARKRKDDGHRMMNEDSKYRCGYDILPDGKIQLASSLTDTINAVIDEQTALDMLMEVVSHHYQGQMKGLNKRKADFWSEIRAGIKEIDKKWLYDRDRGIVYPPPKEKDEVQN